jgi:hypothetical protein
MIRRLHIPLIKPEDVIPHLAKQEHHWKSGHSAQELAVAWSSAENNFPASVQATLKSNPEYGHAELVDAFFEREVDLGSSGRNSQTDLMVILGLADELAVMAVEGKVEESFAELVSEWNTTPGKQGRLERLCETLGLDPAAVGGIRYQLLHRTASAIYEAKRYRCRRAIMLVHSFSRTHRWFEDFAAFSRIMDLPIARPDILSAAKICAGVALRLAWVADVPRD